MKQINKKLGKNFVYQLVDENINELLLPNEVINSWNNSLNYIEENPSKGINGFRTPQLGALFAIKAHRTVSENPATIVMPTGVGKTETMLATIISEMCPKVLIIVPTNLLRDQILDKCISLGILKEFELIKSSVHNPIVACLKTSPTNIEELEQILNRSNIIVTTVSLLSRFSEEYIKVLTKQCSDLFVDEAHHVIAATWKRIKSGFDGKRILQFTATPFRYDGKKMDGKIIYNFPLSLAQKAGYFQPIQFKDILEFDYEKADLEIAKAAIEQLEEDIKNNYKHIVLVRASSQKRAEKLYNEIYCCYFKKYNPVLIISDLSKKERDEALKQIHSGKSKILVCVDMFGEGIDIPNLKIAAMHDKYQSLPITLQFIGRFARSKKGLGDATIVANIANEVISESLEELYAQDSDWNQMLVKLSSSAIENEVSLQELANGFKENKGFKNINIAAIRPKVSMTAYKTSCTKWEPKKWSSVFNPDKCCYSVNNEKNVIIIVETDESKIDWALDKEITNINYQLHILYWNKKKKMAYVNSTNKAQNNKFINAVLPGSIRITGEKVFRCLDKINQLKLGTVGLKTIIDGPIRFKMFAGLDIEEGISESQKQNSTKSNLFGIGYDGTGKVSIGCSYKGTIWSRWIESINFWMNWCDKVAEKLLDDSINVNNILKGALISQVVKKRPSSIPIVIEWPEELLTNADDRFLVETNFSRDSIYNIEIGMITQDETSPLRFFIESDNFREEYELCFDEDSFKYKKVSSTDLSIHFGKTEESLIEFFNEYPPRIRFADRSVLEANIHTEININNRIAFDDKDIIKWDWNKTNIMVESQTKDKKIDSIQYNVISKLKEHSDYSIIFDDDGSGEIADVIAIKEINNILNIEFYHCKFSSDKTPGARVDDLYVVCGQAEKSVYWKQDGVALIRKMLKREAKRNKDGLSKFEIGDLKTLNRIKNKLSKCDFKLNIFIVQPGLDSVKISDSINELLCGSKNYCLETYGVPLKVICT